MKPFYTLLLNQRKLFQMYFITIKKYKHETKHSNSHFYCRKKYAAFALMILATLNANAQRSGLTISIVAKTQQIADGKGGIKPTTATLRKVKKAVNDIAEATKTKSFNPNDMSPTHEKKVPNKIQQITTPEVVTSTTIYDISGATAQDQYTSLQANFIFKFVNVNSNVIGSLSEIIELYKLEKGATNRSFCIPSGNCTAVKIPMQISDNIGIPGNGSGAATTIVHRITVPSGYLAAGEYAFIDKSTLTADGTAMVCFAFTVK
jgi:hypothetical protein